MCPPWRITRRTRVAKNDSCDDACDPGWQHASLTPNVSETRLPAARGRQHQLNRQGLVVLSPSIPHVRMLPARTADKIDKKFGIKKVGQASHTPWHVLRDNGDFRLYFAGSVLSDFGTWLQNSAQVLL